MLTRILWVLLLSLLMISDVFADEMKRLAVLEFRSVDMDQNYLLNLSDQSRRAAVELLPDDEYLIMTRENMMQVLNDMGLDASCVEGQCEVEIGRNIQADVIVTGDVLKISNTYVLTLKLYDTLSGALLATMDIETDDLLTLRKEVYNKSKEMLQVGLKLDGGSVPQNVGFQGSVKSDDWFVAKNERVVVQYTSIPSGAVVLVDGQLLCTATPCSKEVSQDIHQVVFQKERYFPFSMMVDTNSQQQVSASLEPRFGILNVNTAVKGVHIQMDEEVLGKTPISNRAVDLGLHTLHIQDPCYVGQDYRFQMKSGTVESVEYPVVPRESAIHVQASDKGGNALSAKVIVDGKVLGKTPLTAKVPLCSSDLRVMMGTEVQRPKVMFKEHEVSNVQVVFTTPKNNTGMVQNHPPKKPIESNVIKKEKDVVKDTPLRTNVTPLVTSRTWLKSGAMLGASMVLYSTTVMTYNNFVESPSIEMYRLNRTVHSSALVLTTVSFVVLLRDLADGRGE